jgi:hypothetical protein
MARKARIYIIMNRNNIAKKELLKFFEWYSQKEAFNYKSRHFAILISALQDLGYLSGDWPDEGDYLKNISGSDISLKRDVTVKRIKKGLACIKEGDIWSPALGEVEDNLGRLY